MAPSSEAALARRVLRAASHAGPHDRFIRYVLEHPERAAALLHTLLPPGFAARVDWSTLRSHPTALVDPAIRETRGDLSPRCWATHNAGLLRPDAGIEGQSHEK